MVGIDKLFYIVSAKPESIIYSGFRDKISSKKVADSVKKHSIRQLMNKVRVKTGDVYTIPAGRIHSIGKGVTLLEIQRHSSLNFVLSDFEDNNI